MVYERLLLLLTATALPDILYGITTTHHDKPAASTISKMATRMRGESDVASTTVPERQKRLLPYVNYYINQNQREASRENITPFLESNALPGPFLPIVKPTPKTVVQYLAKPVPEKNPNFALIYDTLVQLKQQQQTMRNSYRKPPNYIGVTYYDQPSTKTVVETYTPTSIDIDITEPNKYVPDVEYKIYRQKPENVNSYVIDRPLVKPYYRKPILVFEKPPEYTQEKPVKFFIPATPKPQINTIVDERYVAQKLTPLSEEPYASVQYVSEKPSYEEQYNPSQPSDDTNILAKILKQLQNSNTLPQTFTPQNIDNSIRTLVKILNGLRKQQKLKTKPIVVLDEESQDDTTETDIGEKSSEKPHYAPDTFTQIFPANTVDGGTPGRPGIDYPALSSIPQTDFDCKTQRYKGFFGDPHTNCQVWHYCDLNGGQASFLCPNGTIFSQVALTCDWWFNVKCASTPQLYVLNERLYKYILPLSPKFPEDYSGPLVDKYLALKFQEMEEKMKNEKKKKEDSEEEKDDSDQLQDIQNEKIKLNEEK